MTPLMLLMFLALLLECCHKFFISLHPQREQRSFDAHARNRQWSASHLPRGQHKQLREQIRKLVVGDDGG
jgi:hypothetical protein